jgi:tetratricopeptide (TPR) repeat protein
MDAETAPTKTSPTKGVIVEDADGMPVVEDAEGMPTEKKAEIEEKVADALEENFDKHEMLAKAHNADNTEETTEEETGEDKMETDSEKTEEPGNLEQAWQMFDLAKVIYGKAKNEVKECESLILLGEVSLENSNFKQAVEDLMTCLAKRVKALPADSRSIAETHYQLGVAQAHCEDFANAEKSLKAAIAVLDARVVNLKKMEVSENIKKELAELETLCHDIKERMNDHKDMQKGVYKQDKDFVSVFKSAHDGIVATEIGVKTSTGPIA